MNDENPINSAAQGFAAELAKQLYKDMTSFFVSMGKNAKKIAGDLRRPIYTDSNLVYEELRKGLLKDGDLITLECKPSTFGPFLRDHFFTPTIGFQSDLRLGPQITSDNPVIGMMAQMMSHLTPVGIFPAIDETTTQVCLYPSDAQAMGFYSFGIFGLNDIIKYIPAIIDNRFLRFCHMPCHITGYIRQIGPVDLQNFGFKIEDFEILRQSGNIYFLDVTGSDAECKPLDEGIVTELWGGMYASGHLEINDGSLPLDDVIESIVNPISQEGYQVHVNQNQAARQEIMVFGKGIRACIDTIYPMYSLHMDVDFGTDYVSKKSQFDRIIHSILTSIQERCKIKSVKISNPNDLDFTYSDSSKLYSVLKSTSANQIKDPLLLSIKDWHSRRGI